MFDRVLNAPLVTVDNKEVEKTFAIFAFCVKITIVDSRRHSSIVIIDFEQIMRIDLVPCLKLLTTSRSSNVEVFC